MFKSRSRAADERRILDYLDGRQTLSESPISLATKLAVDLRTTRTVLDRLVEAGLLRRRTFADIEPMYFRNPRSPSTRVDTPPDAA
ncbi:MAG: Winged helix-turn-helix transcriptional regulator [Chloroflexi bacterium]|nr:Winged helix-turn-helix transcriptional regulator [Chloroflexota bacterium]